uniref:Uncharacterized protein n=1 Tax=Anguilla anguilla TaxID=7936 RepID=A0A0E9VE75_ANGAN
MKLESAAVQTWLFDWGLGYICVCPVPCRTYALSSSC